jgi:phosphoglucomutase
MLMIDLADGGRIAVRPSGTEPKIKFYLYAKRSPESGQRFTTAQLEELKTAVKASLDELWAWVQQDVKTRIVT